MTLSAGTKLGPYEIVAPLGAGGMGEVWRAMDTRLDRTVALKVLPEEFFEDGERRERFGREARLLASLNHPGIAAIFSFEEIPGPSLSSSSPSSSRHLLSMELVEGEDLGQRLLSGPLPVGEALSIARQIAEALEAAHEKGIVHRDLKPANVKVTEEGKVKLLDFGLAKALEEDPSREKGRAELAESPTLTAQATAAGVILGTAAYMSPEQARGKSIDKRTDIWAFGCVLYEMLTGKKAFSGETVSDTLAAILTKEPDWSALRAPDSSKVGELLRRCLQRDAKQRLRDIGDARILLEEELAAKASLASVAGAAATGSLPFEEKQAAPSPTVARSAPPSRERGGRKSLYLAWAVAAAFAAWAAVLALRARTPGSRAPGRPLVRFRIAPPSGGSFNGMIALSPDGSRLAAVVTGADGLDRIFLRPLDAVEMHAVPGTDGAAYPFFSPDGRSIGYFASETLRTVDLEKESVRTLCRARNPRGGTWGPDGTILFAANIGGEIDRVPAAGGESSRILAVSADVASLRWPCFLPDGRRFLAFSWNANGKSGLVAGALDSSATVPVMPTDSGAVFASGFLYFLREGKLVRAPFDVAQLKVTGSAEPLGEDVFWDLYSSGYAGFAVSQAGVVAWHAGGLSLGRFVWYDRSGKLLGAIGPPGPHFEPDLSPDGKTVAFSRTDPDTSVPGTWLLDLLRGSLARLSLQPQAVTPLWRPDGKSVAYSTFPAGTVFERDAGASSSAVKLFENGTFCILEDWAPDGRIFFTSVEDMATFRTSIRVRPTGGGAPQTVLSGPFSVQAARLSPDGHWLAYVSDESGIDQVLVRSYPEGNERFTISAGGGTQPRWRGDGKELFYVTPDAKIMSVPISTRPRFEPGRPVMLFQSKILPLVEARNHYVVTRDGQRFLVNSRREEAASFPIVVLLGGGAEPRP